MMVKVVFEDYFMNLFAELSDTMNEKRGNVFIFHLQICLMVITDSGERFPLSEQNFSSPFFFFLHNVDIIGIYHLPFTIVNTS